MTQEGQAAQPSGGQETATVRYGVLNQPVPYVGRTVKEVRDTLHGTWEVPKNANAFKGKTKLDDDYVIQAGDDIQFHRRSGEKG